MKKKYYVAYGSNMDVAQMTRRCPGAKLAGLASLRDRKLVFRTHLTIEECRGEEVTGLLWEITPDDEKNLDAYEGYPAYYDKQYIKAFVTDFEERNPDKVTALVYVMNEGRRIHLPSNEYYETVARAYRRFGFTLTDLETAIREAEEATGREFEFDQRSRGGDRA